MYGRLKKFRNAYHKVHYKYNINLEQSKRLNNNKLREINYLYLILNLNYLWIKLNHNWIIISLNMEKLN